MTVEILTGEYRPWILPEGFDIVELDLGCGKGGFLLSLAEKFPDRLVIGADVMLGRLRKVARKVTRRGLTNVRLLRVNAWEFVAHNLADNAIDRIHILCPDPWPKARHRSKRLVTSEFVGRTTGKLKKNGVLHLSTDHGEYLQFMNAAISPLSCLRADASTISDIAMIKTDFEADFEKAGCTVSHLAYRAARRL